jgi:hypothetical protein
MQRSSVRVRGEMDAQHTHHLPRHINGTVAYVNICVNTRLNTSQRVLKINPENSVNLVGENDAMKTLSPLFTIDCHFGKLTFQEDKTGSPS